MSNNVINYIQAFIEARNLTQIIVGSQVYKVNQKLSEFINQLCLMQGTTMVGRKDAMKKTQQITQKIPIYIQEGLFLFPTVSGKAVDCIWINYFNVRKVIIHDYYRTEVLFKDNSSIDIWINHRIIRKQMNRCKRYVKFLEHQADISFIQNGKVLI